jgi:hypothetical protein
MFDVRPWGSNPPRNVMQASMRVEITSSAKSGALQSCCTWNALAVSIGHRLTAGEKGQRCKFFGWWL